VSAHVEEHFEVIAKRLGRLEQLINVVLEQQEKRALKLERRIELSFERTEYSVAGLREYLQDSFLDEVCEEVKGKTENAKGSEKGNRS
jgi:hypothetical protein